MGTNFLGQRIRLLRLIEGMKQQEFATAIGSSAGYISEVEAGKKIPGGEFLSNVGTVSLFNSNWLLNGQGWTVSPSSQIPAKLWWKKVFTNQQLSKVVILNYEGEFYYDKERDSCNGFMIHTKDGTLSIAGMIFRTNSTSGLAAYTDILSDLYEGNIPTYKINIDYSDAKDLDKKELSVIFEGLGYQIDVYEEMHFYKPRLYPLKYPELPSKAVQDPDELEILELLKKVSPETKREFLKMLKAHAKFKNGLDKIT